MSGVGMVLLRLQMVLAVESNTTSGPPFRLNGSTAVTRCHLTTFEGLVLLAAADAVSKSRSVARLHNLLAARPFTLFEALSINFGFMV